MKIKTRNKILPRKLPEDEAIINYAEGEEEDDDIEVIIASKLEHFMY